MPRGADRGFEGRTPLCNRVGNCTHFVCFFFLWFIFRHFVCFITTSTSQGRSAAHSSLSLWSAGCLGAELLRAPGELRLLLRPLLEPVTPWPTAGMEEGQVREPAMPLQASAQNLELSLLPCALANTSRMATPDIRGSGKCILPTARSQGGAGEGGFGNNPHPLP